MKTETKIVGLQELVETDLLDGTFVDYLQPDLPPIQMVLETCRSTIVSQEFEKYRSLSIGYHKNNLLHYLRIDSQNRFILHNGFFHVYYPSGRLKCAISKSGVEIPFLPIIKF